LEVTGLVETIVEVGELYGWMTAALRSSQTEKITAITPILEISAETNGESFQACFGQKSSDCSHSVGQCWQDLFRNPVVVTGFPVRRRQPGQEPGLECSLSMLSGLLMARNMAVFCDRVFIKGFCTMLVPAKYSDGTVHWHVLFNEDGSRISFTDARVHGVVGDLDLRKHLTLSGIRSARHIVGWCEAARNYAGGSHPSPGTVYCLESSKCTDIEMKAQRKQTMQLIERRLRSPSPKSHSIASPSLEGSSSP
jgi:hypothetical protein